MKKLVLIDSDGTLRRTDGTFSEKAKQVIKKLVDNGHYIVICTGRPRYHTEEIMREVGTSPIIISNNGADIYNIDTKEEIGFLYMNKTECYKLIDYAFLNDIRLIISTGYTEFVTKEIRNSNQVTLDFNNYKEQLKNKEIFQCLVVDENTTKLNKMKELVFNGNNLELKNGNTTNKIDNLDWFTIGNINATKGNALITLSNYLNIKVEDTIAIGNDYNDISMLKEAGFSVCVDNALEEVKEYADYITLSNDDDGVAVVLEKILEGEL